jgi:hypothetical protein
MNNWHTGSAVGSDVLYHYTSLDGLIGILASGKLRATFVERLNDRKEVEVGFDLIKDVLKSSDVGVLLGEDLIDNRRDDRIFVTCFTENVDSLPLWRGYASKAGGGYAIGFYRKALEEALIVGANPRRRPILRRVSYSPQRFAHELRSVEAAAREAAQEGRALPPSWSPEEMFVRAATLKEAAWSDEGEWRLVAVHHTMCGGSQEQELKVIPSLYGPSPMLEFELWKALDANWTYQNPGGSSVEAFIESVWIGPEPNQDDRARGLEMLLRQAGAEPAKARVNDGRSLIKFSQWATR